MMEPHNKKLPLRALRQEDARHLPYKCERSVSVARANVCAPRITWIEDGPDDSCRACDQNPVYLG